MPPSATKVTVVTHFNETAAPLDTPPAFSKAREELQRQNKSYEHALEIISDAYLCFDSNWIILHANTRAASLGRVAHGEIIGKNLWEAIPGLDKTPMHELIRTCMATRQPRTMEYQLPDTLQWLRIQAHPNENEIAILATDISDTKRVEESRRTSEDQYRSFANSLPQLAWMAHPDGWIHWYNERWYAYTGTTPEEMQGWDWEKVHHPEHIGRVLAFVREAWKVNRPWELTFPLRRHDGVYRWFLTRAYPMKDEQGRVLCWIGTNTDIHDQRVQADTLETKVEERTRDLQEANTHLKRINEELRQFNYIASHDLQEPIRKIRLFSDRIRKQDYDCLQESSRVALDRVIQSADHLSVLFTDLMSFIGIQREMMFTCVNLNDIITNVEKDLELMIWERKATIHRKTLPTIKAIPLQMHQLFYNLLSNALKFSYEDKTPEVHISCTELSASDLPLHELSPGQKYYHLVISDNGIGFEQEFADRIFVLFKRLHSQHTFKGTGVGLALCKKVVENHFGRIWAESEPGRGASFHLVLPAVVHG